VNPASAPTPSATTPPARPGRVSSAAALLLIGCGCALLLAVTLQFTREPIARNYAAREAGAILDLTGLDAPPATGTWQSDAWVTCTGLVLLRGAAEGYGGPIRWMLAADSDGAGPQIRRLLVTAHQETPGIADFLNDPDHPWLRSFSGRGADAAQIDSITGATITTRALARSVGVALARPLTAPAECAP